MRESSSGSGRLRSDSNGGSGNIRDEGEGDDEDFASPPTFSHNVPNVAGRPHSAPLTDTELDISLAITLPDGGRGWAVLPDGTRVTSAFRAKEALRLKLQGKNFGQIAYALGYENPSSAHQAYQKALEWVAVEQDLDEIIKAEVLRLEDWASRLISSPKGVDARTVEVLVKVAERKAKLLGLDAPEKHLLKGQFDIQTRVSEVTPDFLADTIRELTKTNPRALGTHSQEPMDTPQADSEASSLPSSATA